MWINKAAYATLVAENAQMKERAAQQESKAAWITQEYKELKAEKDALMDRIDKIIGLKPRFVSAAPTAVPAMPGHFSGGPNDQIKVHETPRGAIERMQKERDAQLRAEDEAEVRAAIAALEEMTNEKVTSNT